MRCDGSTRKTLGISLILALGACGGGRLAVAGHGGSAAVGVTASEAASGGAYLGAGGSGGESSAGAVALTTTTTTTTTTSTTIAIDPAPAVPDPEPLAQQARLTAASVGDHDRRDNYLDYLARHARERDALGLDLSRRVRVRVVDDQGRPILDARVEVSLGGARADGRTLADGIWDLYPGVSLGGRAGDATVRITAGGQTAETVAELPRDADGDELLVRFRGARAAPPAALDLGFLIDVTGSMEDELRYVNAEIADIVARVRRAAPETRVRVGATFYRDRTDRELVQQIAFTADVAGFARAMQGVRASGGGDYPEDMNTGLEHALGMQWTDGDAVRVLVIIADAPPKAYHDAQFTYHHAIADARARGIRMLPVAASGADRTVEYLFRALGALSGAPYVYLTDDSGIGNPHMEADTDRVAVEHFASLLTRLVVSDLRGEGMHEPGVFGPYRQ